MSECVKVLRDELPYNLHIFVNSVEFIAKVIDTLKLAPEAVKVVCSTSGESRQENQRKLGNAYPIGQPSDPAKKVNFYTSTCFEGCDIFDPDGVTFIVSDGRKAHTLLDISTLFTQICGRIRDSRYKAQIVHVYSTTKYTKAVTLAEYVAATQRTLADAESYAAEINSLSEATRVKTLSKIPYINEQYVRIVDNRLVVEKNLANMDIVNFKISRHIYATYVNLTDELQRNGYKVTVQTYSKVVDSADYFSGVVRRILPTENNDRAIFRGRKPRRTMRCNRTAASAGEAGLRRVGNGQSAGVEIPCRQHPPRVGKGAFNRRRL